ncbi:MAG TPA: glycosyltransferase family 39 protein [Patescibacteria group bacterium]|nr:glycosyltransferase family 39 protein [Patescibacteria group bacterium]
MLIIIKKSIKYIFLILGVSIIFLFNIWLINQGSGFTIPRELLFRTQADIMKPLIAFPVILVFLLLINKLFSSKIKKLSHKQKTILIFLFCLVSAFSLSWTVQTNPDSGTYLVESNYLVKNGVIKYFRDWGTFSCRLTMPVMPFLYGTSFKLISNKAIAVILVNLLIFLGIIVNTYLIGRRLLNSRAAIYIIILFSTTPFIITQSHLMLLDLGLTFFLSLSFYLILKNIDEPSYKKGLLAGLIFFIASLTKATGILYLTALFLSFLIWIIICQENKKTIICYLFSWITMGFLDLIYAIWKKDLYFKTLITNKDIIPAFLPLIIVGLFLLLSLLFLIKGYWPKLKKKQLNKFFLIGIIIFYLIISLLFLWGGKKAFYLRTIFIGTNIPIALLFYSSFYFAYKKKFMVPIILIPWLATVNFIHFTMFKHQLYSYPVILLLAVFSLTSFFKNKQKQIRAMLVILAFSLTITYFFFLPMINKHVKNNIRDSVRYVNQYEPQEVVVLFFPVGELGEMFQKSLERTSRCPQPPSITDLMAFYTNTPITYEKTDDFINKLENGIQPEAVFLVYHLDLPVVENKKLEALLNENYIEGPMFDENRGAGVWHVKIKLYYPSRQE